MAQLVYRPRESAVSRAAPVVVLAVLGAAVGAVVGWVVLLPSAADMLDAARSLVPEGFTIEGEGVQEGVPLLGWPDIAGVVSTDADARWHEVPIDAAADAAGWRATDRDVSETRTWIDLRRPGYVADVRVRGVEDGPGAEVEVHVQRDGSEWARVWAAAGAGAVAGGALMVWGRRRAAERRERARDRTAGPGQARTA